MGGSVQDVLKQFKKDHGEKIATTGAGCIDFIRVPSGIYTLDRASGGGIAKGKMSMFFGPESSCKTTIALLYIANYQKVFPTETCIFIDAEWAFDKVWARKLGVNLAKLLVIKPETAEQVVEIAEGLSYATDSGFIVLDSIASMSPIAEIEGAADRMQVGGNAMLIQRMVKKVNAGLIASGKDNNFPTFLFLNQLRSKIGVLYGSPDKFPGGRALGHYCNMIFRTYAKDIVINAVSSETPSAKDLKFTITKNKVPIISKSFGFQMRTIASKGVKVGFIDTFNDVIKHAKAQGYIAKTAKAWEFDGGTYKTLTAIQDYIGGNIDVQRGLEAQLIEETLIAMNEDI